MTKNSYPTEEDEYGSYAKIICKYFLAEGAVKQNYLFGASANENPWDLVSEKWHYNFFK